MHIIFFHPSPLNEILYPSLDNPEDWEKKGKERTVDQRKMEEKEKEKEIDRKKTIENGKRKTER